MLKHLYTVYDKKAQCFFSPFTMRAEGEAIRAFRESILNPQHEMAKHAEDYDLYKLGAFNDVTGDVVPEAHGPRCVLYGIVVKSGQIDLEEAVSEVDSPLENGEAPQSLKEALRGAFDEQKNNELPKMKGPKL